MRALLSMLCGILLVFDQVYCEPTFGDFFEKIPEQLGSAWNLFMTVLRHPIKPKRLGTTGRLKWQYRMTTEPMTHAPQSTLSQVHRSTTLQGPKPQRRAQNPTAKSTTRSKSSLDLPEMWVPKVVTTKKPKPTKPKLYSRPTANLSITTVLVTKNNSAIKYGSLLSDTMYRLRERLKSAAEVTTTPYKRMVVIPRVQNPEPEVDDPVKQNEPNDRNSKRSTSAYKVLKYVYVETNPASLKDVARSATVPHIKVIPY